MKIAILGTGNVATALATGFLAAGHEVTFGSRSAKDGLPAPVASHTDAAASADVIVTSLPGTAVIPTLDAIGSTLDGKVLLDVSNAVDENFELLYPNDSIARVIQQRFPETRVVKSLNTFNTSVMTNPAAIPESTVFLSGDDADAKAVIATLLSGLGWPESSQLDLGGIETARATEHYFFLFFATLRALGTPTFNVHVVR